VSFVAPSTTTITTTAENDTHSHGAHAIPAIPGGRYRGLRLAALITAGILVVEVIGGLVANSLALLSDAGHVLTDLAALLLSLLAFRIGARPATSRRTYGFRRVEILSALINGVSLIVITGFILYQAIHRIFNPEPVAGFEVLVVAFIGLVGNGLSAAFLGHTHDNLNVRGAFLHVVGDAISSVGVILSAVVIMVTGWYLIDPLISLVIALIIAQGAYRLVSDSVNILLEGTPKGLDVQQIAGVMRQVPGVLDIHDLHVWCITPEICTLSSHVLIGGEEASQPDQILREINAHLSRQFRIEHTTLQLESRPHGPDDMICCLGAQ